LVNDAKYKKTTQGTSNAKVVAAESEYDAAQKKNSTSYSVTTENDSNFSNLGTYTNAYNGSDLDTFYHHESAKDGKYGEN
jgi:hypothetical protein